MKLPQQVVIDPSVNLYGIKMGHTRHPGDLFGCEGREDADALYSLWKMWRNPCDRSRCDPARAGSEDEPNGIGAKLGGKLSVIETGICADFDPHGFAGQTVQGIRYFR